MKNIVVFASGSGTNAQAIIDYFHAGDLARVSLVLTNNPSARVLERSKNAGVAAMSFNKYAFAKAGPLQSLLQQLQPDLIVLAGFLWKIPEFMIHMFEGKIINIHPALLPKHGGKGMYGKHVHDAVVAASDNETGITIHYVNENYDEGAIIAQFKCGVERTDNPEDVAAKIHVLEQRHFSKVIEQVLNGQ